MKKMIKSTAVCVCALLLLSGCSGNNEEPEETSNPSTPGNVTESVESYDYQYGSEEQTFEVITGGGYSVLEDTYEDGTKQQYIINAENEVVASLYTEPSEKEGQEQSTLKTYVQRVSDEMNYGTDEDSKNYTILLNEPEKFTYQYVNGDETDIFTIIETGTPETLIIAVNGYTNYEEVRENVTIRTAEQSISLGDIQSVLERLGGEE